ncbi:hypothetical protein V8Z80_08415 [Orrella sp. JC864]|uniref:hypothetical protein n=1 Tax=Orrella sp. JC864 TaxID=3120298 RepID=UPI00300BCDBC
MLHPIPTTCWRGANLGLEFYRAMLLQMDPSAMAAHSTINHHVDGMQYLCLHRTPRLTVKLYLIEEPKNPNSGFLVHPHSHRYAFLSTVLHGRLQHLRFKPMPGQGWQCFTYRAEGRRRTSAGECDLRLQRIERRSAGSSYFVAPDEVHTLRMHEPWRGRPAPVLIGLTQFADTKSRSELYLPKGVAEVAYPQDRRPSVVELDRLRRRCLQLMGAAASPGEVLR